MSIVNEYWQENVNGTPMYRIVVKLKKLKKELRQLHKFKFSNMENDYMVAMAKLTKIQKAIYTQPLNAIYYISKRVKLCKSIKDSTRQE